MKVRGRITFCAILLFSIMLFTIAHTPAIEHPDKKTIGVIMIPKIYYFEEIHNSFIGSLFSGGIKKDDVEIIVQKPLPDRISLLNTVRKFVALDVDVIVSYGTPATLAAVSEQSDIPVVFAGVFDPQRAGIPLKNAAGVSSKVSIMDLLQGLKKITNFSRLGVLYTNTEEDSLLQVDEVRRLQDRLNFQSVPLNIRRTTDTQKIRDIDAILITSSCPVIYRLDHIIDIARRKKIPTASLIIAERGSGVLLTVSANPEEQGRKAAILVMRLLKGESISSLPVVRATRVDVITNPKEAASLGFKIDTKSIIDLKGVIK